VILVCLKLALATALVLAPGWLVARALGVRSVSASISWSLVLLFGAMALTFALGSTITLTLALLVLAALAAAMAAMLRDWSKAKSVPGRWGALGAGALLGSIGWLIAGFPLRPPRRVFQECPSRSPSPWRPRV